MAFLNNSPVPTGSNHTSTEDLSASVLKATALGSLFYAIVSLKVHALAPYCLQSTLVSCLK